MFSLSHFMLESKSKLCCAIESRPDGTRAGMKEGREREPYVFPRNGRASERAGGQAERQRTKIINYDVGENAIVEPDTSPRLAGRDCMEGGHRAESDGR